SEPDCIDPGGASGHGFVQGSCPCVPGAAIHRHREAAADFERYPFAATQRRPGGTGVCPSAAPGRAANAASVEELAGTQTAVRGIPNDRHHELAAFVHATGLASRTTGNWGATASRT